MMRQPSSGTEGISPESSDAPDGPDLALGRSNSAQNMSLSVVQAAADIALELEKAIRSGNFVVAMEKARALAAMRVSIEAQFETTCVSKASEEEISVRVYVCDKDIQTDEYITMKLQPTITIETLKTMMFQKHHFLPELQKWIVGKRLPSDRETLEECGINFNDAVAFLYLLSPKDTPPIQSSSVHHYPVDMIRDGMESVPPVSSETYAFPSLTVPSGSLVHLYLEDPPVLSPTEMVQRSGLAAPVREQVGWECPKCTFVNEPTRPGCEMCATDRPVSYATPFGYHPTEREMQRIFLERENEFHLQASGVDFDVIDAGNHDRTAT